MMKELAVDKKKQRVYIGKNTLGVKNRCPYYEFNSKKELVDKIITFFPKEGLSPVALVNLMKNDAKYTITQLKNLSQAEVPPSPKPVEHTVMKPIVYSWGKDINFIVSWSLKEMVNAKFFNENLLTKFNPFYYVVFFKKDKPNDIIIRKIEKEKLFSSAKDFFAFPNYEEAIIFAETFFKRHFIILKNGKWENTTKEEVQKEILSSPSFFRHYRAKSFKKEKDKDDFLSRKASDENTVEIFVDGSSNNNGRYAWAYVVYKGEEEIYFDKGYEENQKLEKYGAQVGEFLAMLHAMDYLIENKVQSAIVWYDNFCNYDCMQTLSTSKSSILSSIYLQYYQLMVKKREVLVGMNADINFIHSKAHSGIKGNEKADYYAKKAIKEIGYYFT